MPEVKSVNFEKLTLVDDNNKAYLNFQSEFVDVVDKHISIKKRRSLALIK